ncbi:GLPGLI family protein [Haoranjiania flava]|uniref:GLPGLI family protein n=1 Tax=Haoranjiania flava TaxID=1856322 RepID=A0AAE3LN95_9BACT|nr:GLPGLI family protein [Haoranjiania flava]MCU7694736.1 GLPGLI family protein [Haoranjiania flava]
MHRKFIFLIIFFISTIPFCAFSQSGKITYDAVINRSLPGVPKDEMFQDDLYCNGWLFFNGSESIYRQSLPDSAVTSRSGGGSEGVLRMRYPIKVADTIGSIYKIQHQNKKILARMPLFNLKDFYVVDDKLEPINWKIETEKKRIGKFEVIKANADYLGRNWTAWFAPEIPVSVGPWKLYGLPGLILEAEDSTRKFRFLLKEVQVPFQINSAIFNPAALTKTAISKTEFIKIEEKKKDDQYRFRKARMEAAAGPDSRPVKININFEETIEIYK